MLLLLHPFSNTDSKRDEVVLERAQEFLDELPPALKCFTLSITSTEQAESSSNPWSAISPFWAVLCNEVVALNEKLLMLNASLKGVVGEIKGEVMEDESTEQVYKALAENLAPDSWKVSNITLSLRRQAPLYSGTSE